MIELECLHPHADLQTQGLPLHCISVQREQEGREIRGKGAGALCPGGRVLDLLSRLLSLPLSSSRWRFASAQLPWEGQSPCLPSVPSATPSPRGLFTGQWELVQGGRGNSENKS